MIRIYGMWFVAWCGVFLLSASASDWPEFRGPTGQGLAPGAEPPVTWSATEHVAWKTAIPGAGWSSPILYRGALYLTAARLNDDGNPVSLRLLRLDPETGRIRWDKEALPVAGETTKHDKNSHASSTPLAHAGRIYAHFGYLGTACFDPDGGRLWQQTSLSYPPRHGNGGSPVIVGDKLIFNCDGNEEPYVAGLDLATGHVLWKTPRKTGARNKFSFCTPLVIEEADRPVVVSPGSGAVIAYEPESGKELWRVDYGDGYSVVPRPVFGNGLLYVSSGFNTPILFAIRPGGRGDVTDSHVAWKTERGAPKTPSPLLDGNELYYVSDRGMVSCVDATTGEHHWYERMGGNVSTSPVLANGRIYVTDESGRTVVMKAGKTFEILAENDLDERTLASPALDGKALFLRTISHLYRLETP